VQDVIRKFHKVYYGANTRTWKDTCWLGVPVLKCPLDLWIYQEILYEVRPDFIVESGTMRGGSAYYLASVCDLLGHGEVLTIDIQPQTNRPTHARITYLTGSSVDPGILARVAASIPEGAVVLVILDSDHARAHVLRELELWHSLVSVGSYLIVEDTNISGHPVADHRGPGPWEAIEAWLPQHPCFERDLGCEKFFLTFNPGGYLRRVR
jgi:cephalosporin hydroxylase